MCGKVVGYPPWPSEISHPIDDYGIYRVNFLGVKKHYYADLNPDQIERLTK